jgi:hypothetical protein
MPASTPLTCLSTEWQCWNAEWGLRRVQSQSKVQELTPEMRGQSLLSSQTPEALPGLRCLFELHE